jgi:hypothetical protein
MPRAFYHGTLAALQVGDLVMPGCPANFAPSVPNRVYFTTDRAWAFLHAYIAARKNDWPALPRVYEVRPHARRTFRDFSLYDEIPCIARWSCQPLSVLREVPVTTQLMRRAARIVHSSPSGQLADYVVGDDPDLLAD